MTEAYARIGAAIGGQKVKQEHDKKAKIHKGLKQWPREYFIKKSDH